MLIGASFVISLPAKNKQTMPRRHLCLSAQQAMQRERRSKRERKDKGGRLSFYLQIT